MSGLDPIESIVEQHPVLHHSFALEVELDLITDNKDLIKKAMEKWRKIVPAVLKFSESFTGKYSGTLKAIRDVHKDDEEDDLCAFTLLVKHLGKKDTKSKEDPIALAFEKCKLNGGTNGGI